MQTIVRKISSNAKIMNTTHCLETAGKPFMSNRYADWFRQAEADLQHAKNSLESGDFEWSCFAAHQAAEKALKSVYLKHGMDAWGHMITVLIGNLPECTGIPSEDLINNARMLDKYYILTRDPNGFDSGAPTDYYTADEAKSAIRMAEVILEFCSLQIR
jgi:HEPN domain-containing protein